MVPKGATSRQEDKKVRTEINLTERITLRGAVFKVGLYNAVTWIGKTPISCLIFSKIRVGAQRPRSDFKLRQDKKKSPLAESISARGLKFLTGKRYISSESTEETSSVSSFL